MTIKANKDKTFLIIGDNNFWYYQSIGNETTKEALREVKRGLKQGLYNHDAEPTELKIFEAIPLETVEI